MRNVVKKMAMSVVIAAAVLGIGCSSQNSETGTKRVKLDPKNPTTVTVWNYYNGDQLAAFESLVAEFNETAGSEEGIVVVSVSQGAVANLVNCLTDAVNEKVGAQDIPTMAAVYAETGYELEKQDILVNLDNYFTEEELSKYVDGFIKEGRMTEDGELVLFPVSKSTECFSVNATDWAAFEEATGVTIESVDSLEKLTEAAKKYYEWTDSLTPEVLEDGQALYGRDAIGNYIFIGTKQLGHEMFTVTEEGVKVDLDRDTFKKLWDNYYIPYINGYFMSEAIYRSEDMKTGKVLALTGSTSGFTYLPTDVTDQWDNTHKIEIALKKQLCFEEGASEVYVQQGAGYCVIKSSEEEQYAAVEFLKWFTSTERNIEFSVSSGYSPVTIEANKPEKIKEVFGTDEDTDKNGRFEEVLNLSADIFSNQETYTSKPFEGSKAVRDALEEALKLITENDRSAVVSAIAEGKTRQEATAKYMTEEYFDQWFDEICARVHALVQE